MVVQGFGNVGSVSAQLMEQQGMKIVAVSDKSGGIYNPKGLRIKDVIQHVRQHRFLSGYNEAEQITNEQLLTLDCDVLVPAALENVITSHNAGDIKARIICEGANGPTTAGRRQDPGGERRLRHPRHPGQRRRGDGELLRVGPGPGRLLLGRGHGESAAGADHGPVLRRGGRRMAGRHGINMRIGAYMQAIERVAAVHRLRGMYA